MIHVLGTLRNNPVKHVKKRARVRHLPSAALRTPFCQLRQGKARSVPSSLYMAKSNQHGMCIVLFNAHTVGMGKAAPHYDVLG